MTRYDFYHKVDDFKLLDNVLYDYLTNLGHKGFRAENNIFEVPEYDSLDDFKHDVRLLSDYKKNLDSVIEKFSDFIHFEGESIQHDSYNKQIKMLNGLSELGVPQASTLLFSLKESRMAEPTDAIFSKILNDNLKSVLSKPCGGLAPLSIPDSTMKKFGVIDDSIKELNAYIAKFFDAKFADINDFYNEESRCIQYISDITPVNIKYSSKDDYDDIYKQFSFLTQNLPINPKDSIVDQDLICLKTIDKILYESPVNLYKQSEQDIMHSLMDSLAEKIERQIGPRMRVETEIER